MRLMILLFVSAILVLPSSSIGQQPSSPTKQDATAMERARYVGLRHRELPVGLETGYTSTIIGKLEDHALNVIVRGKLKMLWFERMIDRDKGNWEVVDVVVLPTMTPRQEMVLDCYAGKSQPLYNWEYDIAAIVQFYSKGEEEFRRPLRAWRANQRTGRLEEQALKGITCPSAGP